MRLQSKLRYLYQSEFGAAWYWILAIAVSLFYTVGTFQHWSSPSGIYRQDWNEGTRHFLMDEGGFFFFITRFAVFTILGELGLNRSSENVMLWSQVIQTLHASIGVISALAAANLRWRAPDNGPGRQVAGLGMAYALLSASSVPWQPAYPVALKDLELTDSVTSWLLSMLLVYLALGFARLLVIFPRVVDVESVHQAHLRKPVMARWTGRQRLEESYLLAQWHASLVSGRIFWLVPATPVLAFLVHGVLATWLGDGYAEAALMVGVLFMTGFYIFVGLPYAFGSISHLYRYGNEDERRRIAWLRSMVYGAGAIVTPIIVLFVLGLLNAAFGIRWSPIYPLQTVYVFLFIVGFLPLLMLALGVAVSHGGALDPRVAFTRVSLWSAVGLFASLIFVFVERFAALHVVAWLSLPPDTGPMFASVAVGATFLPVRNFAGRAVERLAKRWIPLETVAAGARVKRVVAITDLSGYTRLSAENESAALVQSAALRRQGERAASAHSGLFIKSLGDAVILTFVDPDEAARAIMQLHRDFPNVVDAVGLAPLELHSALHYGELVASQDGDIFGQTVNVTARLVDAAGPGEIVVSAAMKSMVAPAFDFEAIGNLNFKNVPQPISTYRLLQQ